MAWLDVAVWYSRWVAEWGGGGKSVSAGNSRTSGGL